MNPLTLLAGPLTSSIAGGISPSIASKSGDASAGIESPFNYQGAFQVGGSGKMQQDAGLTAATGANSAALWIVAGLAALALIITRPRS